MPILEISVVPIGTGSASMSSFVTEACKAVQSRGLEFQVTPTSTVVKGELGELLQVAGEMHRRVLASGAQRVITTFTIDERLDRPQASLEEPVNAVLAEMRS